MPKNIIFIPAADQVSRLQLQKQRSQSDLFVLKREFMEFIEQILRNIHT